MVWVCQSWRWLLPAQEIQLWTALSILSSLRSYWQLKMSHGESIYMMEIAYLKIRVFFFCFSGKPVIKNVWTYHRLKVSVLVPSTPYFYFLNHAHIFVKRFALLNVPQSTNFNVLSFSWLHHKMAPGNLRNRIPRFNCTHIENGFQEKLDTGKLWEVVALRFSKCYRY